VRLVCDRLAGCDSGCHTQGIQLPVTSLAIDGTLCRHGLDRTLRGRAACRARTHGSSRITRGGRYRIHSRRILLPARFPYALLAYSMALLCRSRHRLPLLCGTGLRIVKLACAQLDASSDQCILDFILIHHFFIGSTLTAQKSVVESNIAKK
jgi:hypothetical protein